MAIHFILRKVELSKFSVSRKILVDHVLGLYYLQKIVGEVKSPVVSLILRWKETSHDGIIIVNQIGRQSSYFEVLFVLPRPSSAFWG